jgi:hypothetical protein
VRFLLVSLAVVTVLFPIVLILMLIAGEVVHALGWH